jgi:hypothetical protein
MTGPSVTWRNHKPKKLGVSKPAEFPALCWRCQSEPPLEGHATCSRCYEILRARAIEMRRRRVDRDD